METMFHSKDKVLVNITLETSLGDADKLEKFMNIDKKINLISFKHFEDTTQLLKDDPIFRKLVKAVKDAQRIKDIYINEYNHPK
jgi:hypothetical protein